VLQFSDFLFLSHLYDFDLEIRERTVEEARKSIERHKWIAYIRQSCMSTNKREKEQSIAIRCSIYVTMVQEDNHILYFQEAQCFIPRFEKMAKVITIHPSMSLVLSF
jgi:hypothetical protein